MPFKDPIKRRVYRRLQMRRLRADKLATDPEGFRRKNNERQMQYAQARVAAGKVKWPLGAKKLEYTRRWMKANPEKARLIYRKNNLRRYGLTIETYEQLLSAQHNRCAICDKIFDRLTKDAVPFVDHDHTTGRVRGILCLQCNSAIGSLDDDPGRLRRAILYLEAFAAKTS